VILWYCFFFFCSVTFIGFQCSIPNTPCNFERFCIGNSTYSNCHNKVVIFFKSCPCTLWDEPHPLCQNANDAQQHVGGWTYQQRLLYILHLLHLCLKLILFRFCFISYSIKGLLFIPFLFCILIVQNTNIHRSVVLSPKTPRMNRWMPRFTPLHLKAMILVWMSMK